jgi:hypothetical protein|tara:strand:- start:129 stop:428 length:300 start_codon:yes stop_codon:yes gene_type:complete
MVAASKMTFPQAHIEIQDNKVYYAVYMVRIWQTPEDREEENNRSISGYFLSEAERDRCIAGLMEGWGVEGTWARIKQAHGLWEKNSKYVKIAMKNASEC